VQNSTADKKPVFTGFFVAEKYLYILHISQNHGSLHMEQRTNPKAVDSGLYDSPKNIHNS